MTRWVLTGCMALGAVAVLDVGSATAETASSASPFAERYVGADPLGWMGSWAVTISDAGAITGSSMDFKKSVLSLGSITGQVSADGSYSLKVTVVRYLDERRLGSRSYKCSGNLASDAHGNIVGTADTGGSFSWLRK